MRTWEVRSEGSAEPIPWVIQSAKRFLIHRQGRGTFIPIIQIKKAETLRDHMTLHKSQSWYSRLGPLTLYPASPLSLGT